MAFFDFLLSKEKRAQKQAEREQRRLQQQYQIAGQAAGMQAGMISSLPGAGFASLGMQAGVDYNAQLAQGTGQESLWAAFTRGFTTGSTPTFTPIQRPALVDVGPAGQGQVMTPIPDPNGQPVGVTVPGPPAGLIVAAGAGLLTVLGIVGWVLTRSNGRRRRR